jgi:hypothetical protein
MQKKRRNYAAEAAEAGARSTLYVLSALFLAFLLTLDGHSVWLWCMDVSVLSSLYLYLSAGDNFTTVAVSGDEVHYQTRYTREIRIEDYGDIRASACFNSAYISFAMGASMVSLVALSNA